MFYFLFDKLAEKCHFGYQYEIKFSIQLNLREAIYSNTHNRDSINFRQSR